LYFSFKFWCKSKETIRFYKKKQKISLDKIEIVALYSISLKKIKLLVLKGWKLYKLKLLSIY